MTLRIRWGLVVAVMCAAPPGCANSSEKPSTPPAPQCAGSSTASVPREVEAALGAGRYATDGRLFVRIPDSSWLTQEAGGVLLKLPWYRLVPGKVRASATHELDGHEIPFNVDEGYGDRGVQPSSVIFPAPGCWELRGALGESRVSLRVRVPEALFT